MTAGISAFGPAAARWADRFASPLDVVVADERGVAEGIYAAVERKRAGKPFFVMAAFEDPRTIVAREMAARVMRHTTDFDRRYEQLGALASGTLTIDGVRASERAVYERRTLFSLRDLMWLGNSLLVRSWTERARITGLVGQTPLYATRASCMRAETPRWKARFGGKHLVVWAPENTPEEVALVAFALEALHTPSYVVTREAEGGAELKLRAQFVGVEECGPLLEEALAIVVADVSDPAPALALARSGVPLAIASTSGAHEYVDGAPIYDPWDFRSVLGATLVALGSSPPHVREEAAAEVDYIRELERTLPAVPLEQPLVSVIVPTKDRREILPLALDSVAAQTYSNVEIVALGDAKLGESGSGKYWFLLDDEALLFPDHLARCVYALERSGCVAAHSMPLESLLAAGPRGAPVLLGHVLRFRDAYAYDPIELLWTDNVGMLFMRRDAVEADAAVDDASTVAAWARFLRLATVSDFACIKVVTSVLNERLDSVNWEKHLSYWTRDLERLYTANPIADRPFIAAERRKMLLRAHAGDLNLVRPKLPPTPLDPPRPS